MTVSFKRHFMMLSVLLFSFSIGKAQYINENSLKLVRALDFINALYVDTVNQGQLVEAGIKGMLNQLDPHSTYLTAQEVKEMNEPLMGNFEGIGVSFNIVNDTIYIVNVIPGGPSEKIGVLAGDKIIKIDDQLVAGKKITNKMVMDKLRGTKGTKVKISVYRRGVSDLIDFTIVRDKIPIYSIDAVYMIDNQTGYIKLNRFSQTTSSEFDKAVKKLLAQKAKNLILDLTDNGGGLLDEAVMLVDHFLDAGKLVVYTKGAHSPRQEFKSTSAGSFEKGKLVVLIDENTASASEIFSGAIQDWDRGLIVGRRSFGKGLVQRPIMFNDGSMIRLTVAHYYTPTGRDIQKPYKKGNIEDYDKDILNRYNNGELTNKDSIHFSDSLKYYTLIKRRVVYGGGGITPDIFVPMDTSRVNNLYRDVLRTGAFNNFILKYVDVHRKDITSKYKTFSEFKNKFSASEIYPEFLTYVKGEKISVDDQQANQSKDELCKLIKASIARDIWDTSEFYEIYNQDNTMVTKALEAISNYESIMSGSTENKKK
jgi:carboxyl-terminal processing protease